MQWQSLAGVSLWGNTQFVNALVTGTLHHALLSIGRRDWKRGGKTWIDRHVFTHDWQSQVRWQGVQLPTNQLHHLYYSALWFVRVPSLLLQNSNTGHEKRPHLAALIGLCPGWKANFYILIGQLFMIMTILLFMSADSNHGHEQQLKNDLKVTASCRL